MSQVKLAVEGLTKRYAGIHALKEADLEFMHGEVHALLGENGAGKSTLCKMLSGAETPDAGVIKINGKECESFTPHSAKDEGIGMIYQEFNLVPDMTVYENIFLGKEIRKGMGLQVSEMVKETNRVFDSLNIKIDPYAKIKNLSVAYCQLVEIGKAMLENAQVLIMDEPTAPLTTQEVGDLFILVNKLRDQGVTIIYITHRIEELLELSDRVTVMRDGEIIQTLNTKDTTRPELIRLMVGRELGGEFPPIDNACVTNDVMLEVENLTTDKIHNISFQVHRGEILGLAGLVGAGRTETLRAIFGADPIVSGTVKIKGKEVFSKNPTEGIKNGIALIPEDRKREGVHLNLSVKLNISLIKVKEMSKFFTINQGKEKSLIERFVNALSIKMASPESKAASLSGGNQQKVVLSKWLSTESDIIFFDEPTRGIDVGAKKEIYDLMDQLRKEGKAIIMVSSEMLEVVGMCNRIIVMHEGDMMGELSCTEVTQERILELASGGEVVS